MKCPNCNGEIGRFELAPNCKHCGVNIFYSQQELLLTRDAKRCELEFASFRILTAKLKTAFIGGPIQILRIVAMVIAIGVIFIPFASVTAELPLFSSKLSFGAFGVYQAFSDGTLMAMLNLRSYIPDVFAAVAVLSLFFVLVFLMGLGVFIALVLSFFNIRKTAKVTCVLSVIGFLMSVGGAVTSFLLPAVTQGTFISASTGFGPFACMAVFVLIFLLNMLVIKKDIKADVKQVDIERVALRKKIKEGEVSLDDLPLPVFETEEEREKRLENEAASKILADKARGGENNG